METLKGAIERTLEGLGLEPVNPIPIVQSEHDQPFFVGSALLAFTNGFNGYVHQPCVRFRWIEAVGFAPLASTSNIMGSCYSGDFETVKTILVGVLGVLGNPPVYGVGSKNSLLKGLQLSGWVDWPESKCSWRSPAGISGERSQVFCLHRHGLMPLLDVIRLEGSGAIEISWVLDRLCAVYSNVESIYDLPPLAAVVRFLEGLGVDRSLARRSANYLRTARWLLEGGLEPKSRGAGRVLRNCIREAVNPVAYCDNGIAGDRALLDIANLSAQLGHGAAGDLASARLYGELQRCGGVATAQDSTTVLTPSANQPEKQWTFSDSVYPFFYGAEVRDPLAVLQWLGTYTPGSNPPEGAIGHVR